MRPVQEPGISSMADNQRRPEALTECPLKDARMTIRANERVAWFNGDFMPEREVRIPFRDSSWVYGDGCFDMARSFSHRLFKGEGARRTAVPIPEISADRGSAAKQ